jgi:hypothetical protein
MCTFFSMFFLESQTLNMFLLFKLAPNVFKFNVSSNIFDKKKHYVLNFFGAHVLIFDF